jgi:hypothetical protein
MHEKTVFSNHSTCQGGCHLLQEFSRKQEEVGDIEKFSRKRKAVGDCRENGITWTIFAKT